MKINQLLKRISLLGAIISLVLFISCGNENFLTSISGNLSGGDVTTSEGIAISGRVATGIIPVEATVTYSIAAKSGTLDSGISVDPSKGIITVSDQVRQGTYIVILTATGKDNYEGELTDDVTITVNAPKTPIVGNLGDLDIEAIYQEGKEGIDIPKNITSPAASELGNVMFSYEITEGSASGISINGINGINWKITIASNTAIGTYNLKVTATVIHSHLHNYTGSITGNVKVTVVKGILGTLHVANVTNAEFGTAITGAPASGITGMATYSIALRVGSTLTVINGVSINSTTGAITVAATAPKGLSSFTVTATGTGEYKGVKTAIAIVGVNALYIADTVISSPITIKLRKTLDLISGVGGNLREVNTRPESDHKYSGVLNMLNYTNYTNYTNDNGKKFPPDNPPQKDAEYYIYLTGYGKKNFDASEPSHSRSTLLHIKFIYANGTNGTIEIKDFQQTYGDYEAQGDQTDKLPPSWQNASVRETYYLEYFGFVFK